MFGDGGYILAHKPRRTVNDMAYIDTKYLFKCETCRHCRGEYKCNTYCDHGEEYSPNLSKIPAADVAPKSEVAREIAEFLFRRSRSLQHLFKDNSDSAQCFRGRFELENAAVIIANEYGVELEKKYTEENK